MDRCKWMDRCEHIIDGMYGWIDVNVWMDVKVWIDVDAG